MLCFLALPLLGQEPAPAKPAAPPAAQETKPADKQQGPAPIRVITNTVVVPVTVKDRNGNLVPDLRRDEFRVFEDNVEQEITRLSVETYPLSLVILIDNDLKRKDEQQVEPSLASIVGGLSTSDEAFICRFDQFFHEGKGFTRDQDNLLTQLKRTELSSEPSVAPPGGPFNGPTINNAPAPGAPPNPAGPPGAGLIRPSPPRRSSSGTRRVPRSPCAACCRTAGRPAASWRPRPRPACRWRSGHPASG